MKKHFLKKVIYQIYTNSFFDANNDGYGDLLGIVNKLPYLKKLNVDLLWISPFCQSPKKDNGYDVSDYYQVDSQQGTINDLKTLINEDKKHKIGIIMDMILNHTSTEHKWFLKALNNDLYYQKFYYFVDQKKSLTNWISKFGGSVWEYVPKIKKSYLHLFDKTQADLNWNNQLLRLELYKIINYWLNFGILGIRFDVINLISKPHKMVDDLNGDGRKFYTDGVYVHKFIKEMAAATYKKFPNVLTIGELSSTKIFHGIIYANPNENELDTIFIFHHLKVDYKNQKKWELKLWNKKEFKQIIIKWQTKMQENNASLALFLNNHDQPRVNDRFGDINNFWYESSTCFTTLNFTLKGVPFIYQGEEIGMTNAHFDSIKAFKDVESLNAFKNLKKKL